MTDLLGLLDPVDDTEPDDEHDDEEAEADVWAELRERRRARWEARRPLGSADPWATANESDRALARRLVNVYGIRSAMPDEDVMSLLRLRFHELVNARWLAIHGGLLRKAGGSWVLVQQGVTA